MKKIKSVVGYFIITSLAWGLPLSFVYAQSYTPDKKIQTQIHAHAQSFKKITHHASSFINMNIIKIIESSGNPLAFNKGSGARGLYQITPIVLKEWNNYHPQQTHSLKQLFNSTINKKIAYWYMNKRIPQLLRHYKKTDSIENRIIAWNAGIRYIVRSTTPPLETRNFIKKYKKTVHNPR